MSDPKAVGICRTPEGGTQSNTVKLCLWCHCELSDLVAAGRLKEGNSGAHVEKLHQHLRRFGMEIDLGDFDGDKPVEGADTKNSAWGPHTTRTVRLFAAHPAVSTEGESILASDGKSITEALVGKIRLWCDSNIRSPKNYWEFKQLKVRAGDLDAAGAQKQPAKQTVLHDFVVQIQRDLAKIGFAPHDDKICSLGHAATPTGAFVAVKANAAGVHPDKDLTDTQYLVRKFQRQAGWLWRMKADGSQLPDVTVGDKTVHKGAETGEVDAATAAVLHEWASTGLHMCLKRFELKELPWPPPTGTPVTDADSGASAKLRSDAQEIWLKAADEIATLGGTVAGPYASSPRSWRGGKKTSPGASPFSWHYSGLAIDLCQALNFADGTIGDNSPYGLAKDGDKFRIWCWAKPQPSSPKSSADDKTTPLIQYRNRNVKPKHVKGAPNPLRKPTEPADSSPLYVVTKTKHASGNDVVEVAAREGWYVDVTAILEKHGFRRIKRHSDWLNNPKGWEWWHYQYEPLSPPGAQAAPTFGEYLQLYGVHELRLRQVGWSSHEDIDHAIG